jgi:hypothetical protein
VFFARPSVNKLYEHLTRLNARDLLRQPQHEQYYQQDDYGYSQQVADGEPWAAVQALLLPLLIAVLVGPLRTRRRYEGRACYKLTCLPKNLLKHARGCYKLPVLRSIAAPRPDTHGSGDAQEEQPHDEQHGRSKTSGGPSIVPS